VHWFASSSKKIFSKMLRVLQAYAFAAPHVRLVCTHVFGEGNKKTRNVVISTQGTGSMSDNIANIFGTKFFSSLQPVKTALASSGAGVIDSGDEENHGMKDDLEEDNNNNEDDETREEQEDKQKFQIHGYVSRAGGGIGRSDNDRQFFFLNGRPVEQPAVKRWTERDYYICLSLTMFL
jgi:DNA mismatch repair protein PMS2